MEAYTQEEAARSRQLGAAGKGIEGYLAPFGAMASAAETGKDIQSTQYPLLSYIIQLLSLYKGGETETTTEESPLDLIAKLIPSVGFNIGL
jgi:hypothetical protein